LATQQIDQLWLVKIKMEKNWNLFCLFYQILTEKHPNLSANIIKNASKWVVVSQTVSTPDGKAKIWSRIISKFLLQSVPFRKGGSTILFILLLLIDFQKILHGELNGWQMASRREEGRNSAFSVIELSMPRCSLNFYL
jgi:hypothetical protein